LNIPAPETEKLEALPLANGDKIIINSAYKMPVISTDMSQFHVMPNPGKDLFVKNNNSMLVPKLKLIPNGAVPDYQLNKPEK